MVLLCISYLIIKTEFFAINVLSCWFFGVVIIGGEGGLQNFNVIRFFFTCILQPNIVNFENFN